MDTIKSEENQKPRVLKALNRASLYEDFEEGMRPTARAFQSLIYSTINKLDDGISKSFKHGLKLSPQEELGEQGENVISFYKKLDGSPPVWTIALTKDDKLVIKSGHDGEAMLTMCPEGNIGIRNKTPKHALDVSGVLGMMTRKGTYKNLNSEVQNTIKADGAWHSVLKGLKGNTMFEVVALAEGQGNYGNHAFLHAIASNAFDGNAKKVNFTRTHFAWWKWWKRIGLRWIGTQDNYELQIKTYRNYGVNAKITYHITSLW